MTVHIHGLNSLEALKKIPFSRFPIPINEFLTTTSREPFSLAMDPAYLNKSEWRLSFPFVMSAERFLQRSLT